MSDGFHTGAGAPRPGQHQPADPARVHAEVDELLQGVSGAGLAERGRVLEQAHDVLVRALATVDKF